MRLPLLLEPLRHPDFRLLWTGQAVSVFGNFVFTVALPFQFFALGATPEQLGTGFAIVIGTQLVLLEDSRHDARLIGGEQQKEHDPQQCDEGAESGHP